jgi:SAM-dependent MidA family methyltransferase
MPRRPATTQQRELPRPGEEAMAHHLLALEKIHQQIERAGGAISFEDYMQMALYMPDYGYYRCGSQKFGASGDFVTAPEVSPLFAHCLSNFALQTNLSGNILEIGAGSGVLAANLLKQLAAQDALPQTYFILEISGELRARQQQTIQAIYPQAIQRVQWLDVLPNDFSGVVVANELLDAMPVRRFHLQGENIYEQFVCWHDGVFCYQDRPSSDQRLLERIAALKTQTTISETDEYLSEVNFLAEDWIRTLGNALAQAVVLLIDYGYPRNAYYHAQRNHGTLMCHYQHRAHPDPLILTTLQDITAYIDFTAMADAALDADMEVCGFTTQAHFLLNMGILDGLGSDIEDWPEHLQLANQVKKLTLPNEMGENFKVMALGKHYDQIVPGFAQHDLRHLL